MEKYHIIAFPRFNLLLSLTFLFCITAIPLAISITSSSKDHRLVLRLIHHDSILSPYYNKKSTISDRANFAIKSSIARLAYLTAKTNQISLPGEDIRDPVIPNSYGTVFFVNISLGDPPISQLVGMDTGSGLLWIQCEPCTNCQYTDNPIYDPEESSTYVASSCPSSYCNANIKGHCDSDGHCAYAIKYADQTASTGTVAFEKFTFLTFDEGTTVVPNILFGCATNTNLRVPEASGILGLDANNVSILSSIGSKFSYCIGNISDENYMYNQLILGNGSIFEGDSTTFQVRYGGLYFVSLEGISIGETQITINPEEYKFNVIIDSGKTLTSLSRSVFEALGAEVRKIVNGTLHEEVYPDRPEMLCYVGNLERDLKGFPVVALQLAEETEIDLDIEGLFFRIDEDEFCMAVEPHDEGYSVIGVVAQQYYNVGFDLDEKKVYFQRIDCQALE